MNKTTISSFASNVNLQGEDFKDRVCCEVETDKLSKECPFLDNTQHNVTQDTIFGVLFGFLVVIELIGCYLCFYLRKKRNRNDLLEIDES